MEYIFKSKVSNHQEMKKILLQQIDLIPRNPLKDNGQNIIHTDYTLPITMHREYTKVFVDAVTPHLVEMTKSLNCTEYFINKYWFQKYESGGNHGWHTHPGTQFTNVYFVECPKGSSTKLINKDIDCQEGDILSFPAFIPHMSPTISDGFVKTVIAFNTDFEVNTL